MFNLIRKFYYKLRLSSKLRNLELNKLIGVLSKYNKFNTQDRDKVFFANDDVVAFYVRDEDDNQFADIFYKNLHIHCEDGAKQTITRISLKDNEQTTQWKLGTHFSEGIKTLEVYLTYDIEVLGGLRCNNTIFKDGYWNEYAFKTLSDVEEIINGYTIESRFNDFYAYEKVWEDR